MLTAVTMVRDEADIIGWTVPHMLAEGVDLVVVADNLSEDDTPRILAELHDVFEGRVRVVPDPDVGFWQAEKMTHLAQIALDAGADWVIPFDADEWFYVPGSTYTLRQWFAAVPPEWGW